VHVGPSDYVPWLKDRKWCQIRMEGTTYGDVPLNVELKLEVWDSPNSAGVITDAIRCAKLGLDRGLSGTLVAPSSYFMKSPPIQIHDDIAHNRVEAFIRGEDNETLNGTEKRQARKLRKLAARHESAESQAQLESHETPVAPSRERDDGREATRAHGRGSGAAGLACRPPGHRPDSRPRCRRASAAAAADDRRPTRQGGRPSRSAARAAAPRRGGIANG
jgi:hypothetical protein